MGGRGSARRSNASGPLISVPERKRKRGKAGRRKKIAVDKPGFPVGTPAKKAEEKNSE
jgi:hypothetical protein